MDNDKLETETVYVKGNGDEENSDGETVEAVPSGTDSSDFDIDIEQSGDSYESKEDADGDTEDEVDSEDKDSDEDSGALGTQGAKSETQNVFDRKSADELVDPVAIPPFYCNIPDVDSEPFIVDTKIFHESLKSALNIPYYTEKFGKTDNSLLGKFKQDYNVFKNDSKKTVNYLVKEFEMILH